MRRCAATGLLACFLLVSSLARAQQIVYGTNKYVEYHKGNLKVILSVPHGGSLTPPSVGVRGTAGCFDSDYDDCVWTHGCKNPDYSVCPAKYKTSDGYTQHLARELASALESIYGAGKRPHIIFNNLFRDRLDANRHVEEATFGDPNSTLAYNEYHAFIASAINAVNGTGLFIDVHGQNRDSNFTHVGMLLSADVLNRKKLSEHLAVDCSLKSLYFRSGLTLDELIRGNTSFGGQLEAAGYKVMPSPKHPGPGGLFYYHGGYSVQRYAGGLIDAIQFESHLTVRKEGSVRRKYASDLAKIISYYLDRHYQ